MKNIISKVIIVFSVIAFMILSVDSSAQRYFQPLGRMYDLDMQHSILKDSVEVFSAVKPALTPVHTELPIPKENLKLSAWLKKHFFYDDFVTFSSPEHYITINPICHFQRTYNLDDKNDDKFYFLNTRGVEAFGKLGKRIYFATEFYENQARLTSYEDSIRKIYQGLPGQGHAKNFNTDGVDWALVTGAISIDINKNMKVTLGNGKNFIGSGYRSVILSDLTFNYPYLRTDLKFGNFYYYVLWGYLQHGPYIYFTHGDVKYKYSSYHVFGWNPTPKFEISAVEGVIWKNTNKDGVYKYSPSAMMPFPAILLPTLVYGFGDDNRVQLGVDANYSPISNLKLYAQCNYQGKDAQTDDKYYGYQLGLQWFDLTFGAVTKLKSHFQVEYTKSSIADGKNTSDFWSYNYPMTTINVVDFDRAETLLSLDLEYYRVVLEGTYQHSDLSKRKTFTLRYMINPKTKWNIYVTLHNRYAETTKSVYDTNYAMIGMSICPQNFYYDF